METLLIILGSYLLGIVLCWVAVHTNIKIEGTDAEALDIILTFVPIINHIFGVVGILMWLGRLLFDFTETFNANKFFKIK